MCLLDLIIYYARQFQCAFVGAEHAASTIADIMLPLFSKEIKYYSRMIKLQGRP